MKQTVKDRRVRWTHILLAVFFCFLSVSAVYIGYLSETFYAQNSTLEDAVRKPFEAYILEARKPIYAFQEGTKTIECPEKLRRENTNFAFTARDENGQILLSTHDANDPVLYQQFEMLQLPVRSETGDIKNAEFTMDYFLREDLSANDIFSRTLRLREYAHLLLTVCDILSVLFAAACLLLIFRTLFDAVCEAKTIGGGKSVLLSLPPDLMLVSSVPMGVFALFFLMQGVDANGILQVFLENGSGLYRILQVPALLTVLFFLLMLFQTLLLFSLRRGGWRYALTYLRFEKISLSKNFFYGYAAAQALKCAGIALFLLPDFQLEEIFGAHGAQMAAALERINNILGAPTDPFSSLRTLTVLLFVLLEKAVTLPMLYRCIREVRGQMDRTERYVCGDLTASDSGRLYKSFAEHDADVRTITDRISVSAGEYMQSSAFKAELITNLSHDIKTPLTAIMSYAQLLRKPSLTTQEKMQYLDVLKRHSARMTKLVEDLTDVSDAATGNVKAELTQVDLCTLIPQAAQGFEERLQKKNISVQTTLPSQPVTVMADTRLLWRVVDNLMNNICKYAKNDTTVQIVIDAQDAATAVFRNVPAFELQISGDALMERFVRADGSRHTEGSGLGLSIAKSLMELQNGRLALETEPALFTAKIIFDKTN
ncbi:MAG: sensor histidine kinase [Acutalibacteraceae bacterium]